MSEQIDSNHSKQKQRFSIIGFICGIIAVMHIYVVLLQAAQYKQIFNDFKLQIPPITQFYLDISDWLFGYYFMPALVIPILSGFFLPLLNPILIQNQTRVLRSAVAILTLLVFLFVFNIIANQAIHSPMQSLITGMTGGKGK